MTITLTNSDIPVLVDPQDFAHLNQFKWHRSGTGTNDYPVRWDHSTKKIVKMHRQIMGFPRTGVDHKNQNRFDNRRENLRLATNAQNQWNRRKTRNNTSGFKGVTWNKGAKKWHSRINVLGRFYHLGSFDCPLRAALIYDEVALVLHGEFASLNIHEREFRWQT